MLGKAVDNEVQLLHLNGLDYQQTPPCSVVVGRELRTHVAKEEKFSMGFLPGGAVEGVQQVYADVAEPTPPAREISKRTVSISIPSGSRYVEPTTSYLCFDFYMDLPRLTGITENPSFVSMNETEANSPFSSVLPAASKSLYTNLFQSAKWIHSGKREIDYVDDAASQSYLYTLQQSSDWIRSVGSGFSFGPFTQALEFAATRYPDSLVETVCIPLGVIFPTWRRNKGQLIPAQLVGGSTFEFSFKKIEQSFLITTPGETLELESASVFDFAPWQYQLGNIRIVLDERELCASMNSMMWEVSNTGGMPMQPNHTTVSYTTRSTAPGLTTNMLEPVGTYELMRKNLSRLNNVMVTPMVQSKGVVLDAFIPCVRAPVLKTGDAMQLLEYRFKTGNGYWPLKVPRFASVMTPQYSFLQWMGCGSSALSLEEWKYYVNGYYMNVQRQAQSYESGVPITSLRPLELNYSFDFTSELVNGESTVKVISQVYGGYDLRWTLSYQRMVNVFGSILQTLD